MVVAFRSFQIGRSGSLPSALASSLGTYPLADFSHYSLAAASTSGRRSTAAGTVGWLAAACRLFVKFAAAFTRRSEVYHQVGSLASCLVVKRPSCIWGQIPLVVVGSLQKFDFVALGQVPQLFSRGVFRQTSLLAQALGGPPSSLQQLLQQRGGGLARDVVELLGGRALRSCGAQSLISLCGGPILPHFWV